MKEKIWKCWNIFKDAMTKKEQNVPNVKNTWNAIDYLSAVK